MLYVILLFIHVILLFVIVLSKIVNQIAISTVPTALVGVWSVMCNVMFSNATVADCDTIKLNAIGNNIIMSSRLKRQIIPTLDNFRFSGNGDTCPELDSLHMCTCDVKKYFY